MNSSPVVSLCLLTYNHSHTVEEAVQSILEQDYRDYELIISDDCSTDETWEIAREFESRHDQIRAVQTPQNLSMPGNANYAASHARGKYIGLLHHDDIYRADLLTRWVDVAERHENVGFVFNEYNNVNRPHQRTHRAIGWDFSECMNGRGFLEDVLFGNRWGSPVRGTALVRRSCWEKVGGMREKFNLLADVDLWMRLADRWDVGYVDEPVITIRQARPSSYPTLYRSGHFSWKRRRILHEIHKENVESHYRKRYEYNMYKAKLIVDVNTDILWWSFYSIIKNKLSIVKEISNRESGMELYPVRLFLRIISVIK